MTVTSHKKKATKTQDKEKEVTTTMAKQDLWGFACWAEFRQFKEGKRKLKIKKKKWQLQWQNKTYEVLHAEQSFAGSKKAKEMTGLDKKQGDSWFYCWEKSFRHFMFQKCLRGLWIFCGASIC